MKKGSGGNGPITACVRVVFMRKNAVFHTKSTCFMNFAILWKPCRTPGLSISRILTEEGAAVPGARACRDQTPAPGWVSQSEGPTFSSVSVQKQRPSVSPKTSFAIVSYSVVMLPFTSCRLSAKNWTTLFLKTT